MFLIKVTDFKFFKNVEVNMVMRQHNIWCVYVLSVRRCVPDSSPVNKIAMYHRHKPSV